MVDGWETEGQFFPSDQDHRLPMEERYQTYCGQDKPGMLFLASQNAALLQFRIPVRGQGFRVLVHFIENPERKYTIRGDVLSQSITCDLIGMLLCSTITVSLVFPAFLPCHTSYTNSGQTDGKYNLEDIII